MIFIANEFHIQLSALRKIVIFIYFFYVKFCSRSRWHDIIKWGLREACLELIEIFGLHWDLRQSNPTQLVKLTQSFLTGRITQLRFNGTTSNEINIEARIPQGVRRHLPPIWIANSSIPLKPIWRSSALDY